MAAENKVTVTLTKPVALGEDIYTEVVLKFPIKAKHFREVYVEDPQAQKFAVALDLLAAVSNMPRKAFLEIENADVMAIMEAASPFLEGAV